MIGRARFHDGAPRSFAMCVPCVCLRDVNDDTSPETAHSRGHGHSHTHTKVAGRRIEVVEMMELGIEKKGYLSLSLAEL